MPSVLIATANISTLQTVATVQAAAAGALAEQEEAAVARAINLAANTGETKVHWNHTLLKSTLTALDEAGYVVASDENAAVTPSVGAVSWVIDWTPGAGDDGSD